MVRRSRAARPDAAPASGRDGIPLGECPQLRRDVVGGHDSQNLTVEAEDQRAFGLAQPDRVLGQRLENRLEIEGGAPDHLEQLAGRRLLLERHPQLAVAFLQLLEQADVLDGDDGLVGEGLEHLVWWSANGPGSLRWTTDRADRAAPSRSIGHGEQCFAGLASAAAMSCWIVSSSLQRPGSRRRRARGSPDPRTWERLGCIGYARRRARALGP